MKPAVSLLALALLSLTACNTLSTRRALYSPDPGSGPYSRALREQTWRYGVKTEKRTTVTTGTAPAAAPAPAPAAPAAPEEVETVGAGI